jgi:response regulator RpfG family c-di-GMP phosphodiesterase
MDDSSERLSDAPEPASEPVRADSEITVLVVDDEPSNVTSLQKIFQREGMRVLTADGGTAALELGRRHRAHYARFRPTPRSC